MHGILSFASFGMKRSETATRGKLNKYFTNIHISGSRLLSLLNDLLDLSKLESGNMLLDIKEANLTSLFESCYLEQEQRMKDLGLTIQMNSINGEGIGMFDEVRVGQVISNILSNAIKFSPKNSIITVTINKDHKYLNFTLKDKGVGIPENELDDVFNAFIQSSQTKTNAGGTGLGLAISKQIIEKHNGEIWAKNSLEGGAIFKFILPLRAKR
jgi:signal transduction histidine kinase